MLIDSEYNPLSQEFYAETNRDPLNFLEFMIVAMLESIKDKCEHFITFSNRSKRQFCLLCHNFKVSNNKSRRSLSQNSDGYKTTI